MSIQIAATHSSHSGQQERRDVTRVSVERKRVRTSLQLPDKEGAERAAVIVKEIKAIKEMP